MLRRLASGGPPRSQWSARRRGLEIHRAARRMGVRISRPPPLIQRPAAQARRAPLIKEAKMCQNCARTRAGRDSGQSLAVSFGHCWNNTLSQSTSFDCPLESLLPPHADGRAPSVSRPILLIDLRHKRRLNCDHWTHPLRRYGINGAIPMVWKSLQQVRQLVRQLPRHDLLEALYSLHQFALAAVYPEEWTASPRWADAVRLTTAAQQILDLEPKLRREFDPATLHLAFLGKL